MVSCLKYWWLWHLVNINRNMSEMSNKNSSSNGVKKAGTEGEGFLRGRGPVGKQREPGLHTVIALMK